MRNAIAHGINPAEALREKRGEMDLGQACDWYIENHAVPEGLKTIDAMRANFERYLGDLPQSNCGRPWRKSPARPPRTMRSN